ncbi:MAG: hypothetical protein P8P74_02330 [Crocinitomicaceae bacterium]|nr:hypothetical protein [Crocinitomicaceae bacterium]
MKHVYTPLLLTTSTCLLLLLSACKKIRFKPNLSETTWVIARYDNTQTNSSEFPMDTIYFLDNENYRINSLTPRTYRLAKKGKRFRLYINDFSTFSGDYYTHITSATINEGDVSDLGVHPWAGGGPRYYIWMTRIQ